MAYRNRWKEFVELLEATALTVAVVALLMFVTLM